MFDLNRSYFNDLKEHPVHSGATIAEEGTILVFVSDGAGGVDVQPCTTDANQVVAGFAITDALKVATETVVEVVTVPNPLGAVQLSHQNIVAASERAVGSVTGAMSEGVTYNLVDATGIITFIGATVPGETVTIAYRYNLTLQESLDRYHERSINNRAQDYFSSVSVGCLEGEIFTSMYDTSVAYTILGDVYLGANGMATSANTSGTVIGTVSQVPGVNDALLGIKYSLPVS